MDTVGLYGMAGTALLLGIAIIAWAIKLAVPHKELTRLYAQAEGIE